MPKAKDTGTKYEEHPVSSGPYKVVSNENDGEHIVLKRNPNWSAETDAERKAYPDTHRRARPASTRPSSTSGCPRAVGADADAVTTDTNLGPAELAKVSSDKELASRVGTGHFGYTNYLAFNPKVKPFDNPKVREADRLRHQPRHRRQRGRAAPRSPSPPPPSCPTSRPSATRPTTRSRRARPATRRRPRNC